MKKLVIISLCVLIIFLVGCGGPAEQEIEWFEWDSESAENQEYTAMFMEVLPSDFDSWSYNKYACNAHNAYSLDILECVFSTGTVDQGTWSVKVVIEAETSNEAAEDQWSRHAEIYFTDENENMFCSETPACVSASSNKMGSSRYLQHRIFVHEGNDKEFHTYYSFLVYENTKISVMEDGTFSNPVLDDMEAIARRIVDLELGEN
ncbi:hypothetical protein KY328_06055 [Candidatus Woesearchaeota archaeon]|nr:hypothetical protein [Candidatus Woesearchaeota archaeon]MBW3022464.1 hypothetical protein [Candidatus Woesearchaeota archaeon]